MTNHIVSPHDKFFRSAMEHPEVHREFFEAHLPAKIREIVDFNTLALCKDNFVSKDLKHSITDMLFTADFAQRPGYLVILAEHQSHPDYWMPFRILKYMVSILEQHRKKTKNKLLPIIFPLVFYHGKTPYPESTDLFDLFDDTNGLMKTILFNPFHLVDVGQIPDKELQEHVWSGVLELCQKYVFARDFLPYQQKLIAAFQKIVRADGEEYIASALTYLLNTAEISDTKVFIETIQHELSHPTGERIMATVAQQWKTEGRIEGRMEGRVEGRVEGESIGFVKGQETIARKMLREKLDAKIVSHLTGLSLPIIQAIAEGREISAA